VPVPASNQTFRTVVFTIRTDALVLTLARISIYPLTIIQKLRTNTSHTCEKNQEHTSEKTRLALAGIEQKPFRKNKSKLAATMQQQWQLKHGEEQADQTHSRFSRRKARRSTEQYTVNATPLAHYAVPCGGR
jgi:hypothetical protein